MVRVGSNVPVFPCTVVERDSCGLVIMVVYHERECLVVDQGLLVERVGRVGNPAVGGCSGRLQ